LVEKIDRTIVRLREAGRFSDEGILNFFGKLLEARLAKGDFTHNHKN